MSISRRTGIGAGGEPDSWSGGKAHTTRFLSSPAPSFWVPGFCHVSIKRPVLEKATADTPGMGRMVTSELESGSKRRTAECMILVRTGVSRRGNDQDQEGSAWHATPCDPGDGYEPLGTHESPSGVVTASQRPSGLNCAAPAAAHRTSASVRTRPTMSGVGGKRTGASEKENMLQALEKYREREFSAAWRGGRDK